MRGDGVYVVVADLPPGYRLKDGDCAGANPGGSKNDAQGEAFGTQPMYLPFIEGDETCAPVWIRRMLEAVPCPKDKRRSTALFCNADLSPFKPALADSLFEDITKRQLGAAVADTVSLHSGRVFLACALLASDAGDPLTKAMIRWKTDASCHIYGRLNPANYAAWLRRAAQATTTAQQVTTLRQRNLYGDNDEAHVTLGDVVTQLAHANVEDTCEPASDSDDDAAAAALGRRRSARGAAGQPEARGLKKLRALRALQGRYNQGRVPRSRRHGRRPLARHQARLRRARRRFAALTSRSLTDRDTTTSLATWARQGLQLQAPMIPTRDYYYYPRRCRLAPVPLDRQGAVRRHLGHGRSGRRIARV